MLPDLTADGLLPAGVHAASWTELELAFAHNDRRRHLMAALRLACQALAAAGCTALYLDGSFVTDKDQPGDYDACWDWAEVRPDLLDPLLLARDSIGRSQRKAKYLGDVFIAGIEGGSGLPFVNFFQQTREGKTKGIVLLNPKEVP
ncbi:MAG: DUF6932 family protein [Actinomycetales bacterium]